MKLILALIIILNTAPSKEGAVFFIEEKIIHFSDTHEGEMLTKTVGFKNIGQAPLVISGYNVACKCTTLKFPKEPILPGQKSELTLSFDTDQKYGYQSRKIEIISNARNKTVLKFKVVVIPKVD